VLKILSRFVKIYFNVFSNRLKLITSTMEKTWSFGMMWKIKHDGKFIYFEFNLV
jgi:hypothetical protein